MVIEAWSKVDEQVSKVNYPLHPCTDDELGKFYPPRDRATAIRIKGLQESGNLFCIDD